MPDAAPSVSAPAVTALLVETESARELLRLDDVIELCEPLPVATGVGVTAPFAGTVAHRDAQLPVIDLDTLLGRARTNGDKAVGALVIVAVDGRSYALAVKRVIGLTPNADPARIVDLRSLLSNLPLAAEPVKATPPPREPEAAAVSARYLLVELAGRTCAFELMSVVHLHADCQVLRAPSVGDGIAAGVTAIGGRVLPVIDLAARLALAAKPRMTQFVELRLRPGETFVVAVERIVGIAAIRQDALTPQGQESPISAVTQLGAKDVWVLTASRIAESRRGSDAA